MIRSTPLRRKTPMKRGGKLKSVSPQKTAWKVRYNVAKQLRISEQLMDSGYIVCERCKHGAKVEGHHPNGQAGKNILTFFLVCRPCHDWIHAHGKEARKEGFLI